MTQWVKWRVVHTSSASAPVETWVPASLAHKSTKVEDLSLRLFFDRALVSVLTPEHLCMLKHLCTSTIHMLISFREGSVVSRVLKH